MTAPKESKHTVNTIYTTALAMNADLAVVFAIDTAMDSMIPDICEVLA